MAIHQPRPLTPRSNGPNPTAQKPFGAKLTDQGGKPAPGAWNASTRTPIGSPRNVQHPVPLSPSLDDWNRMSPDEQARYFAQQKTGSPTGSLAGAKEPAPAPVPLAPVSAVSAPSRASILNRTATPTPTPSPVPLAPRQVESGPQPSRMSGFDSRSPVVTWTGGSIIPKLPAGGPEVVSRPAPSSADIAPRGSGPGGRVMSGSEAAANLAQTRALIAPHGGKPLPLEPTAQSVLAARDAARVAEVAGTGKTVETGYGTASSRNAPTGEKLAPAVTTNTGIVRNQPAAVPATPPNWQQQITAKYPQIGVEGSPENKAFIAAHNAGKGAAGYDPMKVADSISGPNGDRPFTPPEPVGTTAPAQRVAGSNAHPSLIERTPEQQKSIDDEYASNYNADGSPKEKPSTPGPLKTDRLSALTTPGAPLPDTSRSVLSPRPAVRLSQSNPNDPTASGTPIIQPGMPVGGIEKGAAPAVAAGSEVNRSPLSPSGISGIAPTTKPFAYSDPAAPTNTGKGPLSPMAASGATPVPTPPMLAGQDTSASAKYQSPDPNALPLSPKPWPTTPQIQPTHMPSTAAQSGDAMQQATTPQMTPTHMDQSQFTPKTTPANWPSPDWAGPDSSASASDNDELKKRPAWVSGTPGQSMQSPMKQEDAYA
jgi:hypothetical protein